MEYQRRIAGGYISIGIDICIFKPVIGFPLYRQFVCAYQSFLQNGGRIAGGQNIVRIGLEDDADKMNPEEENP